MELTQDLKDLLAGTGVGRRPVLDTFFSTNDLLSEMSKKMGVFEIDCVSLNSIKGIICHIPSCSAEFNNLVEYESHYHTAHRYTCCECKKSLPTAHLLDLHVAETHDSYFAVLAEKIPSYACFLETCHMKFSHSKERSQHCIKMHKFPYNFPFIYFNMNKKNKPFGNKNGPDFDDSSMDVDAAAQNHHSKVTDKTSSKLKEFSFCNSKSRSLRTNKFYSTKMNSEKTNRESKLDSDNMLAEMRENLPDPGTSY